MTNKTAAPFEWKGQQGGPDEPGSAVADDRASWERAWERLGRPAPPADFARVVGVLVFAGLRPTGGYAPAFAEPAPRGDDLLVRYRVAAPEGFAAQALARPWLARLFPRPKGRVIVEAA